MIIQIGGQRDQVLWVQAASGDQHALAFAKIDFAEIEARKPRVVEVKRWITRGLARDNPRGEMADIGEHEAIGQRLAATGPNLQDR